MQKKLIEVGFSCDPDGADGNFGPSTLQAVKDFEVMYELKTQDGTVTSEMLEVLNIAYNYVVVDGFDYVYYANTYADLKKAYGMDKAKLLHHYYKYGEKEGRKIHADAASTQKMTSQKTASPTAATLTYNTSGKYNEKPVKTG